jgi:MFS family permease
VTATTATRTQDGAISRRLRPLYAASFFQAFALWVPIEKLFMTSIGFTAATIGVMAAVYAVIVPILEVPSGILADQWSRRGVLVLASAAALISVVIGGLSQSVPAYMVSAAFLGVFFALQSGTVESIVYDTVLEETGGSDAFESTIGRVRIVESVALVGGALAGGAIAQFLPLRSTYFLTAPLLVVAGAMLVFFREPRLHKQEEAGSIRAQIAATYRTILSGGHLRLVILLTIASSILMQGMFEFGPLWLVALLVPPFLYGPHWAGLTGALGVGGALGSRSWITSTWGVRVLGVAIVACGVVLALSQHALLVIGVQILLTLLVVAIGIPVSRRLHDAVPSGIRAGVASGVGTLTWLAFVPFAVLVGAVSETAGVDRAAWLFVAIGVVAAVLMLTVLPGAPTPEPESALEPAPVLASGSAPYPPDRFLPPDDPDWPGHWAIPPTAWTALGLPVGGLDAQDVVRSAVAAMPATMRQVVVLRDMERLSAAQVRERLGISPADQRAMLQEARALIRARLENHLEPAGVTRD